MNKILVTGGCGYIGSHTIVDLLQNNFEVISCDNFLRSNDSVLEGIKYITGTKVKNYDVDLCDLSATKNVFNENPDIIGIIHFAALKSVGESVFIPLEYYHNNFESLINLLQCCKEFNVPNFIFSSSCSVYGNLKELPVNEETPMQEPESPYGRTKQVGEKIIQDFAKAYDSPFILLRYFNPAGAHESAMIGEIPFGKPQNLVPAITQTAIGKQKELLVFGDDYETRDGSCIRDYIHVMDIAHAHTCALNYVLQKKNESNVEVFNLGTGSGVSVFEMIKSFEKISNTKLNVKITDRRPGDVVAIYSDSSRALNKLNWKPVRNIDEMMRSAWQWEKKLSGKTLN